MLFTANIDAERPLTAWSATVPVSHRRHHSIVHTITSALLLLLLLLVLSLALCLPLTVRGELDVDPCANSSTSRSYYRGAVPYCELFDYSNDDVTVPVSLTPLAITEPANIALVNVSIAITSAYAANSSDVNSIVLAMMQTLSVSLINTTLYAPAIYIYSGSNLTIDAHSWLSSDSAAPIPPPTNSASMGANGAGGGFGGIGGTGCHGQNSSVQGGLAAGDPVDRMPFLYGGSGSLGVNASGDTGTNGFGVGGGLIDIELRSGAELFFSGTISANGGDGFHPSVPAGGGAGGSINIMAERVTGMGSSALVSANGGQGVNGGGGGAGGRIYISDRQSSFNVEAHGGIAVNTGSISNCQGGGQGTIYLLYWVIPNVTNAQPVQFVSLRCIGPNNGELELMAPTDFSNSSTVDQLTVTLCVINATPVVQLNAGLTLTNGRIQPASIQGKQSAASLSIVAPSITIDSESSICADSIYITTDLLQSNHHKDAINFVETLIINSTGDINVQGAITAVPSWHSVNDDSDGLAAASVSTLSLISMAGSITLQGSTTSDVIELLALGRQSSINIQGAVNALFERTDANCSQPVPFVEHIEKTCQALSFSFDSHWQPWSSLVASSAVVHLQAGVTGSILVLCSQWTTMDTTSKINASPGCGSGLGIGAGSAPVSGQPGGGGGHGGMGGEGVSASMSPGGAGITYDNGTTPVSMGSGGSPGSSGGEGGAGGGLVFIESSVLLSMNTGGSIMADADAGSGSGSGGGSGGSIILRVSEMRGPPLSLIDDDSTAFLVSTRGGVGSSTTSDNDAAMGGGLGGSGGGGRIYISWLDPHHQPLNQLDDIQFVVDPGMQDPVDSRGYLGTVIAEPGCPPGFEGILCRSCQPGYYKNVTGSAKCEKCFAGSYAASANATSCALCPGGQYAHINASSCLQCPEGNYSGGGAGDCRACPIGYQTNRARTQCCRCADGEYKSSTDTKCQSCIAGYRSSADYGTCVPCGPVMDHAHYVSLFNTNCSYECDVGYLPPHCRTPFNTMVDSMGGLPVFCALVVAVLVVTLIPFVGCYLRSRQRQREKELLEEAACDDDDDDDEASERDENEVMTPTNMSPGGLNKPSRLALAAIEFPLHLNQQLLGDRAAPLHLGDLPSTSLQHNHFPHHLHRIYLTGNNSAASPFSLLPVPPIEIASLIYDDEFATFASSLTSAGSWASWESWIYFLLCLLCLPLAAEYLRRRRQMRVKRVWQLVLNDDHRMLRNAKSRALASSLLFGCSTCLTLAWIDVLANHHEEKLEASVPVGLPRLPLVLMAAGDGSYDNPYHFDVTDQLTKCPADYFGVNWFKLIRGVNSHLRAVRATGLFSPADLHAVLRLLRMENHLGIGIGKHLPLGGVSVELGFIPRIERDSKQNYLPAIVLVPNHVEEVTITNQPSSASRFSSSRPKNRRGGHSRHRSVDSAKRSSFFRRDDRSPRSDEIDSEHLDSSQSFSPSLTSDSDDEPSILDRALGHDGRKKVEAYLSAKQRLEVEQRKIQARHSSSYASLPAPSHHEHSAMNNYASLIFTNSQSAEESSAGRVQHRNAGSRRNSPHRRNKSTLNESKQLDFNESGSINGEVVSVVTTGTSQAQPFVNLPYSCVLYYFEKGQFSPQGTRPRPRAVSFQGDAVDPFNSKLRASVSIGYRLEGLVLHNMSLIANRMFLACLFLALIFARVALSLIILASDFQLVQLQFILAMASYPLAPLLVPLAGVGTLVTSSVRGCRMFACLLLLSCINDIELILAGAFYSSGVMLGRMEGLLLPCGALAVTIALLVLCHFYVAHLEFLNDLVLSRHSQSLPGSNNNTFIVDELSSTGSTPQRSGRTSRRNSLQHGKLSVKHNSQRYLSRSPLPSMSPSLTPVDHRSVVEETKVSNTVVVSTPRASPSSRTKRAQPSLSRSKSSEPLAQ